MGGAGGTAGAAGMSAAAGHGGGAGTAAGSAAGNGGAGGGAGMGGAGGPQKWRIAVGGQRACAVSAGGVAYCWGTNTTLLGAMLSPIESLDSAAPVDMTPLAGRQIADVVVTDIDLCALKSDGSVLCASRQAAGPVSGIGGPATQICEGPINFGFGFGCAVRADGKVYCWGDSNSSSVNPLGGVGAFAAVEAAGVDSAVSVACGGGTACALQSDGTTWCWGAGWGTRSQTVPPSTVETPRLVPELGSDTARIQGGEGGICAFSHTGVATCLGPLFGIPQYPASPVPVAVSDLNGASALAIGDRHLCALGADGALRCRGANEFAQLADGTFVAHTALALATAFDGAGAIAGIGAGEGVTCVSLDGGIVRCVGSNDRGAMGDGSALNLAAAPVALASGASVVAYQAAYDTSAYALLSDGSVVAWGELPPILAPAGGPALQTGAPAPVAGPPAQPAATQAFVTNASACVLGSDGAVRCLQSSAPATFSVFPGLESGATALSHNCAVPEGGGVTCNVGISRPTPSAAPGAAAKGAVAAIAVGFGGTCLLRPDGSVECWNTVDGPDATVMDLGGPITALAVGDGGCGLRNDGAVLCWPITGYTDSLSAQEVQLPEPVAGITSASATVCHRYPTSGSDCFSDLYHGHTCAWTAAGVVYCWGGNSFGQLGDGTTAAHTDVVKVTVAGGPVVSAAAGNRQTCALRAADHRLVCWGWNGAGELGTGTGGPRATATTVSLP